MSISSHIFDACLLYNSIRNPMCNSPGVLVVWQSGEPVDDGAHGVEGRGDRAREKPRPLRPGHRAGHPRLLEPDAAGDQGPRHAARPAPHGPRLPAQLQHRARQLLQRGQLLVFAHRVIDPGPERFSTAFRLFKSVYFRLRSRHFRDLLANIILYYLILPYIS